MSLCFTHGATALANTCEKGRLMQAEVSAK